MPLMIASMTPTAPSTISVWPRNSSTSVEDFVETAGHHDVQRRAVGGHRALDHPHLGAELVVEDRRAGVVGVERRPSSARQHDARRREVERLTSSPSSSRMAQYQPEPGRSKRGSVSPMSSLFGIVGLEQRLLDQRLEVELAASR